MLFDGENLIREGNLQVEKLNEMASHLITEDGEPKPETTVEQLMELNRLIDEFKKVQRNILSDLEEFKREIDPLEREFNETREIFLKEEKKSGVKFGGFIAKLFKL